MQPEVRVVIMGHVISVPLFEKEVLNGMFRGWKSIMAKILISLKH